MDKITIDRIQKLHPKLRAEATLIYSDICAALTGRAMCRFSFTLRTFAEQQEIYNQGRTRLYDANGKKLGIVTNAQAGHSLHNYGLAVDIALCVDRDGNGSFESSSWENTVDFDKDGKTDWSECVAIFKRYGWEWGGDWKSFKDLPHFQKTFGHSVTQLLALHNAKKVDCDGYVLI
jgi:peptidoglycan L-alanyl-D-glutamate endopeptidase CwlK